MSKVIVDEIQTDTTNGNVRVIPNGTGALEIKGAGGDDAILQLNCSAQSHGVKLKSPAHSAGQSYTMILPDNQIAADKFLKVKSITGSPANQAVGQLEFADVAGGGALEFVSKTTLTSAAAYIDFTGLDDNSIYIFYGKKIKFDATTWATFAFLDGSGATGNRDVAYVRSATYSSGGGSGSVGTYGNSPETYPNSWPGGGNTLSSFRLEVGTSATNNFFMYKAVAVKDGSTVLMGYGETTGSLATTSSTDRIHGVRFDVNNSGVNYDVGTEILVYKLKES